MAFKVDKRDYQAVKEYLNKKLKELSPDNDMTIFTQDEALDDSYLFMKMSSTVFSIFSLVAIIMACLGLFSLSLFSVLQRTKEIGIRKALGASTISIVVLFVKELLKWVVISCAISFPIGFYFSYLGVRDFDDRTPIGWWIYALAGFITLSIGLLTILFHTIKAAKKNPVESLKYE